MHDGHESIDEAPAEGVVVRKRRKGIYILPNLFTTGGLFAGFYAIILTLQRQYELAAMMILVATLCDVLDGRIARLTRSTSSFGIQYDSLSDLVAFGVAPGILIYQWALQPWGRWGWLAATLYVTCGALRLARFNVQIASVEKRHFVGLPIPAAADLVAATVLLYYWIGREGLEAAMRAYDGRGSGTRLLDLLRDYWPDPETAYIQLQGDPSRVAVVASFAEHVASLAAEDSVAALILLKAARELSNSVVTALSRVADDADADEPPVVCAIGGVFRSTTIRERFDELVREAIPRVQIVAPQGTGLDGAAALAALPDEHPLHSLIAVASR